MKVSLPRYFLPHLKVTVPETVLSNVCCSIMLDYPDLFGRTEMFLGFFFGLNQLSWRNEHFLLRCFGLIRSVWWSDGAFTIVYRHPPVHQYEYLVFLVVTSEKFFYVPLYSATCSWGQDLLRAVSYVLKLFSWSGMVALERVGSEQNFCRISWVAGESCFSTHQKQFLTKTYINMKKTTRFLQEETVWIYPSM